MGEYLDYAGYKRDQRRDEAWARIDFHLNSHDFHYVYDVDAGMFFYKATSLKEAQQKMTDCMSNIKNVVQMDLAWYVCPHPLDNSPENLVNIIRQSNVS